MKWAWMPIWFMACEAENEPVVTEWQWDLPVHFPVPEIPETNPMSEEKVWLGRLLFHDFQLSFNGDRSCGICHEQQKGFTDGFARSVGTDEQAHPRNALPTMNLAWRNPLTWRDPDLTSLEEQVLVPLLGHEPITEMGMGGHEELLLDRLSQMSLYNDAFATAFPGDADAMSIENVARAIAAYERSIVSGNSPYDQWLLGDLNAMNESAQRGRVLFFGDRLNCWRCHSGLFLDQPILDNGELGDEPGYFNIGLYNVDGKGSYPPEDTGLYALTGEIADMGRFRTPSLRNVSVTGPWGHDGSLASLDDVVTAYARGGRNLESGQYAGDGAEGVWKDPWLTGFALSEPEREDLIHFLAALTDEFVLTDDRYANPFCLGDSTDQLDCVVPVMGPGAIQ